MGKILKVIFILSLSILFIKPSLANEIDRTELRKMFESCADSSFKNYYEKKYHDYLKKSLILKITNSTPYEMFFEDCEFEHKKYPINFKVKNSVYKEEINEVTRKVFEICADQRYFSELNGDIEDEFLSKPINIKAKYIDYDWSLEFCEDEYRNYPIKFNLKYNQL